MPQRIALAAFVVALLLAPAACGGGATSTATKAPTRVPTAPVTRAPGATEPPAAGATASAAPGSGNTVAVSLVEFAVRPSPVAVSAGTVTFNVQNNGTIAHNFVVIRTDLADDALPIDKTTLSADISKLDVRGQPSLIQTEETQQVAVALPAGQYVLICNLPYHYQAGMHVSFSVQ